MLGVGVVPFTMESLGVYLFAGAFRYLGGTADASGPVENADTVFCWEKKPRGFPLSAPLRFNLLP